MCAKGCGDSCQRSKRMSLARRTSARELKDAALESGSAGFTAESTLKREICMPAQRRSQKRRLRSLCWIAQAVAARCCCTYRRAVSLSLPTVSPRDYANSVPIAAARCHPKQTGYNNIPLLLANGLSIPRFSEIAACSVPGTHSLCSDNRTLMAGPSRILTSCQS